MDFRKVICIAFIAALPCAHGADQAPAERPASGQPFGAASHLARLDQAFLAAGGGSGVVAARPAAAKAPPAAPEASSGIEFIKGSHGEFAFPDRKDASSDQAPAGAAGKAPSQGNAEAADRGAAGSEAPAPEPDSAGVNAAGKAAAAIPPEPVPADVSGAKEPPASGTSGDLQPEAAVPAAAGMIADARSGMGSSGAERRVEISKPAAASPRRGSDRTARARRAARREANAARPGRAGALRDENGAVTAVHNGLEDVTASDLSKSGALAPASFPKSPWEDEVRRISGYSPDRPPLPDGTSAPSIAELDREIGGGQPRAGRPAPARRSFEPARRTAVYTRPGALASGQAPSKAEADEARMIMAAPRAGSARIPDASELVRN